MLWWGSIWIVACSRRETRRSGCRVRDVVVVVFWHITHLEVEVDGGKGGRSSWGRGRGCVVRQRCLVVVKVGHRLERSEEVGDDVGSVLGEDFIFGIRKVLIL